MTHAHRNVADKKTFRVCFEYPIGEVVALGKGARFLRFVVKNFRLAGPAALVVQELSAGRLKVYMGTQASSALNPQMALS